MSTIIAKADILQKKRTSKTVAVETGIEVPVREYWDRHAEGKLNRFYFQKFYPEVQYMTYFPNYLLTKEKTFPYHRDKGRWDYVQQTWLTANNDRSDIFI